MKVTRYSINTDKVKSAYRVIMLSDVHNKPFEKILAQVSDENPDLILVCGDIVDRHRKTYKRALPFLRAAKDVAPTYFSYGNHEMKFPVLSEADIVATGVTLLDNDYTYFGELCIGGQKSLSQPRHKDSAHKTDKAEGFSWLSDFEKQDAFKILMNHHPEYFEKYLKDRDIDVVLAGHAHGGQWRIGKRGVLAPGQGLFAKYVHGWYDNMLVGTGVSNTAAPLIPRFFNPREIIVIEIRPEQ